MTFRYELDSEKPGWSVDDDCVDIKNPDLCFIFLHGYTSGPEYWDPRIKAIKNDMRIIKSHKKIVYIRISAPYDPMTIYGGIPKRSFYPFYGRSYGMKNSDERIIKNNEDMKIIIDEIKKKYDIEYKNMTLLGFSQGGAVSLILATTIPDYDGKVVALSTYYPEVENLEIINHKPHILYLHGTNDNILDFDMAKRSYNLIKKFVHDITFIKLDYIKHEVSIKEIHDHVIPFLISEKK